MHCHFNFKNGSKDTGAKRYERIESPGTPGSTGAFSPAAPYESAPMGSRLGYVSQLLLKTEQPH